uniref:hemagglutinin repeat-containing protein n=1 Tax=Burkholderia multivorans TaxID=87883 RepID=UPI0021BE7E8B
LHTSDQTLTGTTLKGGDTVNIVSGKDITLSGSAISLDKGNANLLAAGDVNVGAVTETHEFNSHETHSHSNVVSGVKGGERDRSDDVAQSRQSGVGGRREHRQWKGRQCSGQHHRRNE